jgi:hypothetical protein
VGITTGHLALLSARTRGVWDVARAGPEWCGALGGTPPLWPATATELDAHTSDLAWYGARRATPGTPEHSPAPFALRPAADPRGQPGARLVALGLTHHCLR